MKFETIYIMPLMDRIKDKIKTLYPDKSDNTYERLTALIKEFKTKIPHERRLKNLFSEKDAIFICYADHIHEKDTPNLKTLDKFLNKFVKSYINRVHFLPFSPYSSDDGFSVIDYYRLKDGLGTWGDIKKISKNFILMFDLVVNHISVQNEWFKKFLDGDPKYQDYFISFDKNNIDTSKVFRPRTHPLLTKFETKNGPKYVWTTFSADQVDINFKSPDLFLEIIKVILFYIENGAQVIRLDAVGFIWKELGTTCIHLPKAHLIIKLFRDILEIVAPNIWLITETNVPHKDNISYFGNGQDEAHLVYNFTLPPLLLHTFLNEDSTTLSKWAKSLELPSNKTSFFNFTASHDGVGVTPLKNIVSDEEIDKLSAHILKQGGKINYRTVPGEKPKSYELNIVYKDAVGSPEAFLTSQAIELSLKGVPAVYFNSLIGADSWKEGVEKLGYNRAINRQKFEYSKLEKELEDRNSSKENIYHQYRNLLKVRTNEELFSPLAEQEIINLDPKLFAILRSKSQKKLLCLFNISKEEVKGDSKKIEKILGKNKARDLITNKEILLENLTLSPYTILWLK